MSNLYQDAILDAKALRASAMANAKAALEEAFEPKIKELVNLKLTEELDEMSDIEEAMRDEVDETYDHDAMEESTDINEAELEEILAQLEELSHSEGKDPIEEEGDVTEALNEAEEDEDDSEEEEAPEEEDEDDSEEDEIIDDETKVVDITLGDLKQILQSMILQSMNQEKMPVQDMGDDEIPSDDEEAESEISLEEILAELEEEESYNEAELEEKEESHEDKSKMEEELEEAKSTIETLRQNLQEVNLLNAKYLYMNKLFKTKSLTESEKVKVINALDRAVSVKEVKNTYETLKESFVPKKQLKESIGFASQAAGIAPKKPIIEQDNMFNRWQKLAGIK
jgi:hypothetical protein